MKRDRLPEDDDGRTVADMSGVGDQPSLFIPRGRGGRRSLSDDPSENSGENVPRLTREEKRTVIGAALRAGLLIALVFIAAGALLILLLQLIWNH